MVAATAAAVGSTTVLANAFGGGHDNHHHSPASARPLGAADMVLHHGKISTVDTRNTTVEAIAIRHGDILATGSNKTVMRLIGRGTKVINLKGRRVLPGLIDGHLHGMREGYHCWTQGVRLDLITSRAERLRRTPTRRPSSPMASGSGRRSAAGASRSSTIRGSSPSTS